MPQNIKEENLDLRSWLKHFGFCNNRKEPTIKAANKFLHQFESPNSAFLVISTVYFRLDEYSQEVLSDLIEKRFPDIANAGNNYLIEYEEISTDQPNPEPDPTPSNPWL